MTALLLALWLLSSILIGTVLRLNVTHPAEVTLFLGWISILILLGYGFRFVSPTFHHLIEAVPQEWLLGIQFYRNVGAIFLPLMVLHVLPPYFALPAGIGDLLSGLPMLWIASRYAHKRPGARTQAILINLLGILDFMVALGIGSRLLLTPAQAIFGVSAVTTAALPLWPLVLIPTFVVPLGLTIHLHSLTNLMGHRYRREANLRARGNVEARLFEA